MVLEHQSLQMHIEKMTKLHFNVKSKAPLYLLESFGQLVFTVSPAPKAVILKGGKGTSNLQTHISVGSGTPWPLPECILLPSRAAKRQSHSLLGQTLAIPVI